MSTRKPTPPSSQNSRRCLFEMPPRRGGPPTQDIREAVIVRQYWEFGSWRYDVRGERFAAWGVPSKFVVEV